MNSSPYIGEELKAYLRKFKVRLAANQIESLVSACVNKIAREMPTDPYSEVIRSFEQVPPSLRSMLRRISSC